MCIRDSAYVVKKQEKVGFGDWVCFQRAFFEQEEDWNHWMQFPILKSPNGMSGVQPAGLEIRHGKAYVIKTSRPRLPTRSNFFCSLNGNHLPNKKSKSSKKKSKDFWSSEIIWCRAEGTSTKRFLGQLEKEVDKEPIRNFRKAAKLRMKRLFGEQNFMWIK